MQKLSAYFFTDFNFKSQALWFKRLLYLFLIIESISYVCYYDLFFGENSIVYSEPKSIGFFKDFAFVLYNSSFSSLGLYFILFVLLLSAWNLFSGKIYSVSDFLLWLLVLNIHNRIYPALTGGDNLMNQFLFFNCFLSAYFQIKSGWKAETKVFFHNLACMAIIIQVCIVYFLSALAKLSDDEWLNGGAIRMISRINYFSLFSFLTYSKNLAPVLIFLNYIVLFYQLFFPLLICVKNLKKPLLILGILMHLYIAFVMGLVAFGFIMIVAYVFFWPLKPSVS